MPDCGRHDADEIAWLEHLTERARAELVGVEVRWRCMTCGAMTWAPALGDPPECHDFTMAPVATQSRRADARA